MIVKLTKNSNDEVRELSAMNFLGRDHMDTFRRIGVRKYDMNFDHPLFFQPITIQCSNQNWRAVLSLVETLVEGWDFRRKRQRIFFGFNLSKNKNKYFLTSFWFDPFLRLGQKTEEFSCEFFLTHISFSKNWNVWNARNNYI